MNNTKKLAITAECFFKREALMHSTQKLTNLCDLWTNTRCLCAQLLLLLLHLRIRLRPQIVWYDLVAKHWDALLCKFLRGGKWTQVEEMISKKGI